MQDEGIVLDINFHLATRQRLDGDLWLRCWDNRPACTYMPMVARENNNLTYTILTYRLRTSGNYVRDHRRGSTKLKETFVQYAIGILATTKFNKRNTPLRDQVHPFERYFRRRTYTL